MLPLVRLFALVIVLAGVGSLGWYLVASDEEPLPTPVSLAEAEEDGEDEELASEEEREPVGGSIDSLPMPAGGAEEEMKGPGEIHGVLRGLDGKPVPGATVKVTTWTQRKHRGRLRQRRVGSQRGVTNREGRFFFRGLPVGRQGIDAWTRDRSIAKRHDVMLTTEEPKGDVELALAEGHELGLTFVDLEGRPVVNGAVTITSNGSRGGTPDPIKLREGLTDAQGRFTVDGLRNLARFRVKFEHAEYYISSKSPRYTMKSDRTEIIKTVPFATLAGRVEDPEGRPVPGAEVELAGRPLVFADDRGAFFIEGIRGRKKPSRLLAATSDLLQIGRENVAIAPGENKKDVVIKLRRAGVITGRVADVDDRPLRGVTVRAKKRGMAGRSVAMSPHGHLKLSGRNLEPVLLDVAGVNGTVTLSQPSGWTSSSDPGRIVSFEAPSTTFNRIESSVRDRQVFSGLSVPSVRVDRDLSELSNRMATLEAQKDVLRSALGKSSSAAELQAVQAAVEEEIAKLQSDFVVVQDGLNNNWRMNFNGVPVNPEAPTDKPISLRDRIGTGVYSAATDEDGRYRLVGMWPGEYRLRASVHGFLPAKHPQPLIIPEEGGELEADFVLNRGAKLVIALTRTDGASNGKVTVEVINQKNGARNSTSSNWQSTITIDGLGAGDYMIRARGGRRSELVDVIRDVRLELDEVYEDIELKLAPGATIEGQVLDTEGRPVKGAQVNIHGRGVKDRSRSVKTDQGGRYSQGGLFAGTYVVEVRKKGFLSTKAAKLEIQHQERRLHDVELSRGLTLKGTVTDAEGNPLPKINVFVRPRSNERTTQVTSTDENGQWQVHSLPPEAYNVYARSDDRTRAARAIVELDAETARDAVQLRMAKALLIRGQLSDANGGKIGGLQVTARAVDNPNLTRRGRTNPDGSFEVPNLYPGSYYVSVRRDNKELPEKKRRPKATVRAGLSVPKVKIVLRD